ncbi:MAG: ComF family protein, partial [Burkholderiales bacterium]
IDIIRDRHIGVVDDVMTTGETLNELASTLKHFGAAQVTNFVFARTLLA